MIVEKIGKQDGRKNKYTVEFSDGKALSLDSEQIAVHMIYLGRQFDDEEFLEFLREMELSESKSRVLRMLGNRTLSAKDIERRLITKGTSKQIARETVNWLESIGLINDREYAHSIVRHYTQKGYGSKRIKQELFKRGIDREFWDDAMCENDGMEEAALSFVEKKLKDINDPEDVRRVTAAMGRRGYSYEEAKTAIKRYIEES